MSSNDQTQAEFPPVRRPAGMSHARPCLQSAPNVGASAFELPFMTRMTIGVLATATGLKVTTIRYYERTGLMPAPARSTGRHRTYTDEHRRRLLFICRARELKFSIEEIKLLLVLAEPGRDACRDVHHLAAAHLQRLRQSITGLVKIEALLAEALARCSRALDLPCAVLEVLKVPD
jgi:MerR family transcriptional regulator, mercuric resistance operon regulatory protein